MPEQRKTITKEIYMELLRLADDGCPLVVNIEDYEIVEEHKDQSGYNVATFDK